VLQPEPQIPSTHTVQVRGEAQIPSTHTVQVRGEAQIPSTHTVQVRGEAQETSEHGQESSEGVSRGHRTTRAGRRPWRKFFPFYWALLHYSSVHISTCFLSSLCAPRVLSWWVFVPDKVPG
jgi:hypothetical protein